MATPLRTRSSGPTLRHLWSNHSIFSTTPRCRAPLQVRRYATTNHLPKIAQTSVWTAMIPRFIRNRGTRKERAAKDTKSTEWNPATFYIIIFTLIGSQAIRLMTLKNDYAAYRRTTDAKIELLREVIEKVKRGRRSMWRGCWVLAMRRKNGNGKRIEEEDSLWHQKNSKSESPQKQSQTPKAQEKDSVAPATANLGDESKIQSTRKTNFF
ncbi:hypothetical protein N7510_003502 [Penicillium lagena]|uniref:uncharacterized protein n=1 Tax=Penicillium lagena TaxID=94218 RepID=UPI00254123C1|nr:uncharacterized protein N7510_003502 [Penicillium lagena]KAJ5619518.1 hypothetical protein N7510_003502 [Penicillium lagena]